MKNGGVITQSRLRTLRSCAYKHHLMYERGFRPVRTAETLATGTLLHVGLEAWWLAVQAKKPQEHWLRDALLAVGARAGTDAEAPFRLVNVEEMLTGYHHAHRDHALRVEVIGVELGFTAPLLNPDKGLEEVAGHPIAGKIDVLIRDEDGDVVIVEHKTTSFSIDDDGEGYWQKLAIDPQVSFYFIGAETLGHVAEGCLYDVVRKVGIERARATPMEKRKYTKATKSEPSRLYAGQREVDETPEEYRARVREIIQQNPDRHFRRREIPRTDDDIVRFLRDVCIQVETLDRYAAAHVAPKNPDACIMFGKCAFWEHCAYNVDLATRTELWHVIDDAHPELVPAPSDGSAVTAYDDSTPFDF